MFGVDIHCKNTLKKNCVKAWKITEICNGAKEKMKSLKNAEKWALGRKNRRWYSRERASERVQKMYALKEPVGDRASRRYLQNR